jgi:hypothetical protein
MVPGAPHGFPGYDTVCERTMIVAAMGADCEQLGAGADQQHFLIADVAN